MIGVGCVAMLVLSSAPLDAEVSTSSGAPIRLKVRWGKPTVLFYEDRHSTALNQVLKDELIDRGRKAGLLEKVSVIAVANLSGFNWFPAKQFALSAVKDAEKVAGIPVYIDWSGNLSRAPWSLGATTSTVMVIDADGKEVWRAAGALKTTEREQVFSEVVRLLETPPSSPQEPEANHDN